jgi:hypothetical protein
MFPELKALIRKFGQNVQGGLTTLRMTFAESLAIAQVEGAGDEMTRAGLRYSFGFLSTVTGIAAVQAIPTTNTAWLLWNPAANPNTIFIDELGVVNVSGSQATTTSTFLMGRKIFSSSASLSTITAANIPIANATGMVTSNRGVQSASNSQLIIGSNITVVAGSPFETIIESLGSNTASATALAVALSNRQIAGTIAIPPGTGYGLSVFNVTVATLWAPYGVYREYATQNQ